MRPIDIRFDASPGWRRWLLGAQRARGSALSLLSLIATGTILAWTAGTAWYLQDDLASARRTWASLTTPPRRATAPTPPAAKPAARAELAAWTEAVQRLNTPWTAVLDGLESLATPDVALLSIEAEGEGRRLRLTTEARDLPALMGYAQRLGRTPGFESVRPLRHDTYEQDPARPVRLTLQFNPGLLAGPGAASQPEQAR
ncbi:hypothetical protein JI739_07320 [Ramlibacter sp. AW1]|uniref:Fimbrial assembly protein n=1 Tax=Ramlibacter aurantiacus TaxID=2801330 RepID=A0A937D2X3_9BURK|nr:hypothetical protein [Ramlibacter aurantiacus]MBL0420155.1 hypothetical protein [Ramlibacter aurantiacus]